AGLRIPRPQAQREILRQERQNLDPFLERLSWDCVAAAAEHPRRGEKKVQLWSKWRRISFQASSVLL
ncbi:MAG TPA: hypothetical protein VIT23_17830, partial [Terrimicrobiaceae bacterium]